MDFQRGNTKMNVPRSGIAANMSIGLHQTWVRSQDLSGLLWLCFILPNDPPFVSLQHNVGAAHPELHSFWLLGGFSTVQNVCMSPGAKLKCVTKQISYCRLCNCGNVPVQHNDSLPHSEKSRVSVFSID